MSEVKTYEVNCNDARLNTAGDDISGSYVKYADYMALATKLDLAERACAELAAENAWLKAICDDRRRFIMNGVQMGYIKVPAAETDPDLETIRIAISPQKPIPDTDAFLDEVRAQAAMDSVPVKRVNADQMRHVCLEANRHLDKYGAMANEVNKLLGRIKEQPAPVVRDEHLLQSLETRINSLEICERKGEFSTQQAISLKAYRLAVHCLRSSATSDENSTDTTSQQFESLAKSE